MNRPANQFTGCPDARAHRPPSVAALWWVLVALGAPVGPAAGDCLSASERLEVLLADGQTIAFRAVWLGIDGKDWFASREVGLGANNGAAENPPFKTWIGGAFVGTPAAGGNCDWFYYLAETEVTRAQWHAVMHLAPPTDGADLPKTGVTLGEVYGFLDRLTVALQGVANPPEYAGALAFARLPTEAEWVYAAQGGKKGCAEDLQGCPHPYGDDLVHHEWTQRTADGALRPVGPRAPEPLKANPLGLYDMLGNASELTASLYGPEYLKGRVGHFVLSGGEAGDADALLTVSHRREAPSGSPAGLGARVGVRPVLSTPISRRRGSDTEYAAAWKHHQDTSDPSRPDLRDRANPLDQTMEDLQGRLQRVEAKNNACEAEKYACATQVATLEGRLHEQAPARNLARLQDQRVTALLQENDRLQADVAEHRRRVDEVSRLKLLVLMREASFYAFQGWWALKSAAAQDARVKRQTTSESNEELRRVVEAWREKGHRYVKSYSERIGEIARDPSVKFFEPVKSQLQSDLQSDGWQDQAKTLPLVGRHVGVIRAGGSLDVQELIKEFPDFPVIK